MGLSLSVSLLRTALAGPEAGMELPGPGGAAVDYWWTPYLYQLRFRADPVALTGTMVLYLAGFLLSLHAYALATPTYPHRRAALLLAAVGSASAALLSVDLIALLFFCWLALLALWLQARLEAPRDADRMLLLTALGMGLLTAGGVLMWQETGSTAMGGLPLTLLGGDPRRLRALGLVMLFGFLPLLAAVPAYRWLSRLTQESLRGAMVCGVLLVSAAFALTLRLLPGAVALPLLPGLSAACLVLGLFTLLWGAVGAWASRSLGSLACWLTVAQSGHFLLALGTAARPIPPAPTLGVQAVFLTLLAAPLALTAVWSAVSAVRARVGTDTTAGLSGLWRPLWLPALALLLGGLSVAGMPPLPGFWTQRLALLGMPLTPALMALVLDVLLLLGVLGACYRVFLRPEPAPPVQPARRWLGTQLLLLCLLVLGLTVALTAGPAQAWVETVVRGALVPTS